MLPLDKFCLNASRYSLSGDSLATCETSQQEHSCNIHGPYAVAVVGHMLWI